MTTLVRGTLVGVSLFPIVHSSRLRAPARIAALYRGLGERRVALRGFHTTDPAEIADLVRAIDPALEHTLTFADGTLAPPELEHLARTEGYGYLDVRTSAMALWVWPGTKTWAHSLRSTGPAETLTLDEGLRVFAQSAPAGIGIVRGFIQRVAEPTKPALLAFLTACRVRVDVVLELDLEAATDLAQRLRRRAHDWQAGGVLVDSPSGKIHGFLKSPNMGPEAQARWRARVDRALQQI